MFTHVCIPMFVFTCTLMQFLGKVGVVNSVSIDETKITLIYSVRGAGFRVVPSALKKVNVCLSLSS